jgi:serine/threonine protein kinase/tetratricopeptide (TPR) repeat protein
LPAGSADPLVGRRLLHYEVLEKLGEGGMGVVYKARDPRLDRFVALKVLPRARTDDPRRRERFAREARAASALNHPHIVTIHDIASEGDLDFIVMEYVDGRSLNRLIPHGGLPVPEALELALQIADAVAAAHRAGIVHRDLKPGNVVVASGGRLRVLDFGLAKLMSPDPGAQSLPSEAPLTEAGSVLGTFSYMAPEQAMGVAVDHRADIFSFGVVLYEMVTGELPFRGANPAAIIHEVRYGTPKPVSELVPGVPPALQQVIDRALAKEPPARYRTMEALMADLRQVASGAEELPGMGPQHEMTVDPMTFSRPPRPGASPTPSSQPPRAGAERTSIAVLPFTSLSSDQDDAHLAAGIAAELISALSGVPDLRVASYVASSRFLGGGHDLQTVAEALSIRYLLTGSLRRAGSRIRVMAELTDAERGVQLWVKTYERALEDVFAVQEEIAREIVSSTGGQILRAGSEQASRVPPESLDAWGLVRRAYHFWNHNFTVEGVAAALDLLRRAVKLDPGYAAARAFLGLYLIQRFVNFISPNPAADVAEALAAAEAAVGLAPRDPEVLENAGLVRFNAGRYEEAVRALQRAVEIAPFNLVAWGYLGLAHVWSGEDAQAAEGEKILDHLLKTAPDHPSVPYWLYFKSAACARRSRHEEARDAASRSVELQPHYFLARLEYANALGALGQTARAMEEVNRVVAANPAIGSARYAEMVLLLSRTKERASHHLDGLRRAGWVA